MGFNIFKFVCYFCIFSDICIFKFKFLNVYNFIFIVDRGVENYWVFYWEYVII